MLEENAKGLTEKLKTVDALALELQKTFAQISLQHQKDGGYIEYLYLSHFLEESLDISHLFQHLFKDENTKRFLAISNRMLLEVILKAEYIIRLKNQGNDKVILSLASKDMASMMSALNDAVDSQKEAPVNKTLTKLNIANKRQGCNTCI
ncbi:MAG: hypothetical protein V4668_02305 [Patescibacteria group bacterium]